MHLFSPGAYILPGSIVDNGSVLVNEALRGILELFHSLIGPPVD